MLPISFFFFFYRIRSSVRRTRRRWKRWRNYWYAALENRKQFDGYLRVDTHHLLYTQRRNTVPRVYKCRRKRRCNNFIAKLILRTLWKCQKPLSNIASRAENLCVAVSFSRYFLSLLFFPSILFFFFIIVQYIIRKNCIKFVICVGRKFNWSLLLRKYKCKYDVRNKNFHFIEHLRIKHVRWT